MSGLVPKHPAVAKYIVKQAEAGRELSGLIGHRHTFFFASSSVPGKQTQYASHWVCSCGTSKEVVCKEFKKWASS